MNDRFGLDSRIITPYSPLAGMGFVPRLTKTEIDALEAKKIADMSADLFNEPKAPTGLGGLWDIVTNDYHDDVEKFRKRRDGYLNQAKAELGGDAPIAVLKERAFASFSIDKAFPDFDRYQKFTTKYLQQIKTLTANGVMDSAANLIRQRVETFPLDIPFFGQLSIYDIKLDNMLSMDNLIDTVKNTNWTDVSKAAISTFAPANGYANYGMKALDTAVGIANNVATLSSTMGAIGFSAGLSAVVASVIPWVLAAIVLIAIGEKLWGWLSGSDEEDAQEAKYEEATAMGNQLHAQIEELLLLDLKDTNFNRYTVKMRLNEMSAYGSAVRDSLWKDCKAITRADTTPTAYCSDPLALRSDGTNTAFVPIRAYSSKGETKKRIMTFKVEYLKSVIQYLSAMEEIGDRRLAFEYLGMTTLPNSVAFSRGLWSSDSYKSEPLKLFKPAARSKAELAEIARVQAQRQAQSQAQANARIAAYAKAQSPPLSRYLPSYKQAANTSTTDKKSVAPLLIGAAAASAVYIYYNR
jgi:hypothetical protein